MPTIRIDNIKEWPPERFEAVLREAMENTSPVDALVETAERLGAYEERFNMKTSEFYEKFMRGEMGDDKDYIAWAGIYEIFLHQKRRIEVALMRTAVHLANEAVAA